MIKKSNLKKKKKKKPLSYTSLKSSTVCSSSFKWIHVPNFQREDLGQSSCHGLVLPPSFVASSLPIGRYNFLGFLWFFSPFDHIITFCISSMLIRFLIYSLFDFFFSLEEMFLLFLTCFTISIINMYFISFIFCCVCYSKKKEILLNNYKKMNLDNS